VQPIARRAQPNARGPDSLQYSYACLSHCIMNSNALCLRSKFSTLQESPRNAHNMNTLVFYDF
jgi:hypothetical protein